LTELRYRAGTKLAAKLKRDNESQQPPPTLDAILQALGEHIDEYNDAVEMAHKHSAEKTEVYSRFAAATTALVHQDTAYLRKKADDDAIIRKEQLQQEERSRAAILKAMRGGEMNLKQLAERQGESQEMNQTLLMRVILEMKRELPHHYDSSNRQVETARPPPSS
jgi:hypothetical protein